MLRPGELFDRLSPSQPMTTPAEAPPMVRVIVAEGDLPGT
jgi:hypothetical protein